MTTWELATDADKRQIRALIDELRKAGRALPPFPATAQAPDLQGLTKRDAGVLTSLLRQAKED
jgi:hypothetical protein